MNKAQLVVVKKIAKLVFFSLSFAFMICMSAPFSITSNAYAIGIGATQSAFDSLLATGGLSGARPASGSNEDWQFLNSVGIDQDTYLAMYGGFFDDANNYYSGLGDYLISRIKLGASTGSLILDKSMYDEWMGFLSSRADYATGTLNIGSYDIDISVYPGGSTLSYLYEYTSYGTNHYVPGYITFEDGNYDILVLHTTSADNDTYYFLPSVVMDHSIIASQSGMDYVGINLGSSTYSGGIVPNIYFAHHSGISYYSLTFDIESLLTTSSQIENIYSHYLATGSVAATGDVVTTVLADGTEIVVNPAHLEDGDLVWGSAVITLPDSSINSTLIKYLQEGVISLKDYLATLNLGLINDGMTDEEKQAIIDGVAQGLTNTITIGETGASTISEASDKVGTLAHVEHAIANAIALATGQSLPYPDEDPDYVPPGNPHIQDWDFPSLDPDNPDPGGSEDPNTEDRNRAADVADGISVVASLAGDIFDSASGFNLVTTVGFSFVIFSAILGASHFFGALGGRHDDVKAHPLDWNRSERWSSKNTDFKSDW